MSRLKVYQLQDDDEIHLDGRLDESAWHKADSITHLLMVEPQEGIPATEKTTVRILMDEKHIYLGIRCYQQDPTTIIYFSKIRDSYMGSEDYIKFVFDTNLDGRTGYIFAINPAGTRYDALVANFGEGESRDWDAIWEAHTTINGQGWIAEINIPIHSIAFDSHLQEWGFNIERRIQYRLEIDRWSGIKRDYHLSQVIHAGRLIGIPDFNLGWGLISRVALIASTFKEYQKARQSDLKYSLDFSQKITSDVSAQLTLKTDFAETEVDARRTNLTRFPLFFPEKRTFFLEGADIFSFGIGLGHDLIPFYSRRIGLYSGQKIPIDIGGKINGKVGRSNFGALITRTARVDTLIPAANLGVVRFRQNIGEESTAGIIGTFGNPQTNEKEWLLGADVTYQNSHFLGDKNFLVGFWGLYNQNSLSGDHSAVGFKIDYPNDLLDMSFTAKRIGEAFQPSLGFVREPGIYSFRLGLDYMPRPHWSAIRQFFFESGFTLVTHLDGQWEFYRLFTAPFHFLLESGDRFEFNIVPTGEYLPDDFEISKGVIIPRGKYHWRRYRLEFETAAKRLINGQATWWLGSFYRGRLHQIEMELNLRPTSSINVALNFEKNIARLKFGKFTQNLFAGRIQYSFTPNFELSSFIQYDSDSKSLGSNTRLRWTFSLLGDLFIVYNHNVNKIQDQIWQYQSNQFILKISYGFWH